ncbi:MAG: hypothetical protein OXG37_09505 [Actinomycetia bacterium]|nr:hypothetical protein [Actinomycetes bacterium]
MTKVAKTSPCATATVSSEPAPTKPTARIAPAPTKGSANEPMN